MFIYQNARVTRGPARESFISRRQRYTAVNANETEKKKINK